MKPLIIAAALAIIAAVFPLFFPQLFQRLVDNRRAHHFSGDYRSDPESEPKILVCFASQSGFAESIAWKTASLLSQARSVELKGFDQIDIAELLDYQLVLFIVSTTGKGSPPDNALPFATRHMKRKLFLPNLNYAILALGNRDYDDYCAFGRKLDIWLMTSGADRIRATIEVDNADEHSINTWFNWIRETLGSSREIYLPEAYLRWKLIDREQLNIGSQGAPLFHLVLSPIDPPPVWKAGDHVAVFPGPVSCLFSQDNKPSDRVYSIASIPADGTLSLVVRQRFTEQGEIGVASQWLTVKSAIGNIIALKIRTNSSFHPPQRAIPMIFIGNGSGIGGIRAHLKHRVHTNQRRNWIIFGERNSSHDSLFNDEIQFWQQEGFIDNLDLVFSRDTSKKYYVQSVIQEKSVEIKNWIFEKEAAIYICGSAEGMGTEVHELFLALLGRDTVMQLIEENRYCRDIY